MPGSASASSNSPYDSGYDHGCDDAGISESSERYINQPEKGPSYHTSEFMDGYYAGLNSCSTNDNPQLSDGLESNDEPYCDEVSNSYDGYCWDRNVKDPTVYCGQVDELGPNETCHDRKDESYDTGLYTCLDGSQEKDWRDCEGGDVEETNEETENSGGEPYTATETENSGVDDETEYYEEEPECFENNDGASGDPVPCE